MQMEKIKLDADRRIQEQKRNFNRRFSEKQVIEERRKRREARIIETKVQNGRRAQINADNRARKAEAARNREYENKKRAQLKANTNSRRVKRLEKNYANLRNKTKSTLNRYNLNRKRAFTQLSESQTKMRKLSDKLRKEVDRANLERNTSKKLQSDLDDAKLKIDKSEQRIKEIEKERVTLNTTITDLQTRLETNTKNGNEDEVDRLTKELDEAKTKIEKLTNEVTTLTNNTKQVVADATKDLNAKLAQAVLASNANKKKAALSEAKYKAARSEMNSKNQELALRERDSKSRKRVKLNALLTNIGVTNKTSLMNEYNAGIKNGKNPNDMINSIVKRARLSNREAARTAAGISATAVAKASMQNELNKIKDEKEQALKNAKTERNAALKKAQENKNVEVASARMVASATAKASMQSELNKIKIEKEKAIEKAANERRNAVAAAEKATREKALAETATEKAAAEQKLKNAQTKINAAVANKKKALENAKTERNATLKKALKNKNAATRKAQANLNTIRKEKENALTRVNIEKKKAIALAEEATRAKAAANTLAKKNAAEKKAAEAKRIQEEVAAKMKAASNKAKAAREKIDATLRAKAQQARIVEQKQKNEKLVSNRQLVQDKMAMVAKMRKILATYKGTDPIRKASIATKGGDLMRKIQKGELKMVDVEKKAAEIVRDMKTKNVENAEKQLITNQTRKAAEQFATRKKNLAKRLTAAASKNKVDAVERKRVENAKRRAITARIKHAANKQKVINPVNIKLVRNNPLFNMKLKRNVQFENALAQKGKMRTNPLALNTDRKKNQAIPVRPSYKNILQKQNPGAGVIRPARMAGSSERIVQRRRVEKMNMGPERVQAARRLASNISRNAARERIRAVKRQGGSFF
jgi:colicin import membrane protein